MVSAMHNRTFDKCTTILYTEINSCKFQWTSPSDVGEEQSNDFGTRNQRLSPRSPWYPQGPRRPGSRDHGTRLVTPGRLRHDGARCLRGSVRAPVERRAPAHRLYDHHEHHGSSGEEESPARRETRPGLRLFP